MEKRERRDRYRRNQVFKQHHGPGAPTQRPTNESDRPEVKEKKVIDHTAIPDPHMFDNLKRETDEIAALTDRKHVGKRQIFSNWAKYETPPEEPEEEQPIGADYETMIQSAQIGSQFQFRSERSWDPKHLPVQSAAFTIDLGLLAASLACLPLYEKLHLPLDVFSNEEVEHMERQARYGQETWKYKSAKGTKEEGLPIWTLEKLTDIPSDKIASQLSSMAADSLCYIDTNKSSTHTPDREVTPKQDEKESFDFGNIPMRGSSGDTGTPLRKERPLGLSPKEQTPEPVQPVPKQRSPAPLGKQEEDTPRTAPEQPLPTQQRPAPLKVQEALDQEKPAAAVEATTAEEETKEASREVPAKKKSRGGKNKAGKRRSWGPDGEESPATPASATPQPQPDKAKTQSPREQTAKPQLQHATKGDSDVDSTAAPQPLSPAGRQTPPREERMKKVEEDTVVPKQTPLQRREEKKEQRKPAAEVPADASVPLYKAPQPSSPTGRQTPPGDESVKKVEQDTATPNPFPLQPREEKKEQRKPVAEAPTGASASLHKGAHKDDAHQLDKSQHTPPQTTAPPDDQLDFLLSLRKPVPGQQVLNFAAPTSAVRAAIDEDEPAPSLQPPEREKKTEDLEDWLDSMLDD